MCSKDWAAQNLFDNRLLNHCKQLRNYGTPGLFCFVTFIYVRLSTQPWFSSHCCSATNQDVLTDAVLCITQHCVGVDALKRWRETYGAMHRVLANPLFMQLCTAPCSPLLSLHNPLFLQLCMASRDFSPGCQFLLRIPSRQNKVHQIASLSYQTASRRNNLGLGQITLDHTESGTFWMKK